DVEEELDRLRTHIKEVRHALMQREPCGRRLDFLMQEFNREANTLASKSLAASTPLNAVQLKVLVEQMREQIQNIESRCRHGVAVPRRGALLSLSARKRHRGADASSPTAGLKRKTQPT